jgi:hypothetical protein
MQDAAKRISDMIHARACREYGLAFGHEGGTSLDFCIIHNSLVGRETGKPWAEVNYDHMRKAAWLLSQQHEPSRLVTAWYRRKCGLAVQS